MRAVGIIANPASGKDIRRLVAHGSSFSNNEKINIVRRVLLGLDALGIERVHFLPDSHAIVPRAADGPHLRLQLEPLPIATHGLAGDSRAAARCLAELGVGCLVTLGGDGTNRVVAQGCGEVPLVAISTGTNNVFPTMVEGTLAGLAAALVATGLVSEGGAIRRAPRLDVWLDGELRDLALVDVVTARQAWIGARALWDPAHVSEVVLSRVTSAEIGFCGLGGLLFPEASSRGVHLVLGGERCRVLVPLAPGLVRAVPIAEARLLEPGDRVRLQPGPYVVALDGEREIEVLHPEQRLEVSLNPAGPYVVDIGATLRVGSRLGVFVEGSVPLATASPG